MSVNLAKIDLATINLAKINLAKIDFAGTASGGGDIDYSTEYLTVEVPVGTELYMLSGTQYSYNKSTWTECTDYITTEAPKVYLKKTGSTYSTNTYRMPAIYIKNSYDMVVSGNILSLIYGDDFKSYTEMPSGCHYKYCFNSYLTNTTGTTNVGYYSATDARNLVLPSNTQYNCYEGMFACHNTVSGQTIRSLKYPPKLPAMNIFAGCYQNMFYYCQDLENAPELPATALAQACYDSMFRGCTDLTTAPELPATTLISECYNSMFRDCTGLTTAPELPATTLVWFCYANMFRGCTSLTTAPELPATTLGEYCCNGMFRDCTSLTTAPELHATTLAGYCYRQMFRSCTKITEIKAHFKTTTGVTDPVTSWLSDVTTTGTLYLPTDYEGTDPEVPSTWTISKTL